MNFSILNASTLAKIGESTLRAHKQFLIDESSTAWIVPRLEKAQKDLEASLPLSPERQADYRLSEQVTETDRQHDEYVRSIIHVLQFAEHMALTSNPPDEHTAKSWVHIRETLFPEGRYHTRKAYLHESSDAAVNCANLNELQLAQLKTLYVHKPQPLQPGTKAIDKPYTAFDMVNDYKKRGFKLGELLSKRASGNAQDDIYTSLGQARIKWMNAFRDLYQLLPKSYLAPEIQSAILGPIKEAIDKQLIRNARQASKVEDTSTQEVAPEGENVPTKGEDPPNAPASTLGGMPATYPPSTKNSTEAAYGPI